MSHRAFVLSIASAIIVAGCTPFPMYAYRDETRVESPSGAAGFSEDEIQRARAVGDELAKNTGMVSGTEGPAEYLEADRTLSARHKPPRRFLMSYAGTLRFGRPLLLKLELSEDGRTLYFSLLDPNQGEASPTFARIDALLKKRVEAAFPGLAITHEGEVIGPFFTGPL